MKSIQKGTVIGVTLLAISGLNVYLPDVGNLFDVWRVGFSVVAFFAGWMFLLESLND